MATVVITVLLAMFVHGLVTNPQWDWAVFFDYFTAPSILKALQTTLWLTLWGTVLGFGLGTVLAAMRLSQSPLLQSVSWTYIWLFRSVPLIVNLLFWYNLAYLYPSLSIGIPFGPSFWSGETLDLFSPMTAAVIGLAVHQAAYSSEVMRSGLVSVDHGQREAAAALGIPRLPPVPQDRAAAGDAHDPADRCQRGHQPVQEHLGRLRDGDRRAVLPSARDLQPQRCGVGAADGGDRLVPRAHDDPVDRAVLRRAALRPRRGAPAAADAAPALPWCRRPCRRSSEPTTPRRLPVAQAVGR